VLIGFDELKRRIYYRNPGTSITLSYTSESDFEKARKSYGTDEDILFVYTD